MKRLILHILFAIVLTGNDVWADTCSDLGYTQTSVSSCAGEYLVCPDDTSKIYCIERNSAFTNIVPNWTSSSTLISTSSSAGTSKFPSGNGWSIYHQLDLAGFFINKQVTAKATVQINMVRLTASPCLIMAGEAAAGKIIIMCLLRFVLLTAF